MSILTFSIFTWTQKIPWTQPYFMRVSARPRKKSYLDALGRRSLSWTRLVARADIVPEVCQEPVARLGGVGLYRKPAPEVVVVGVSIGRVKHHLLVLAAAGMSDPEPRYRGVLDLPILHHLDRVVEVMANRVPSSIVG